MPRAITFQQAAKQLSDIERVLETADGKAVKTAAKRAKEIQLRHLSAAAPSLTLRVGRNRAQKIGVGYSFISEAGRPAALIKARGAVHLLERDTKPHVIPRVKGQAVTHTAAGRRKKGGKVGTARAARKRLLIGGDFRTSVMHPGTKGKHPWKKGADEVERTVHVDVFAEVQAGVLKVIG